MNAAVHCPFCGALLNREWSRWHSPTCPSHTDVTPDDVLEAAREVERRLVRVAVLVAGTISQPVTHDSRNNPTRRSNTT